MNNISIKLDDQEELEFDVSINVDSNNLTEQRDIKVRFLIEDGGMNYTLNAYKKEEGGYAVLIPIMENKISEGSKNCSLEVICNNRYFPAWTGKVDFKKSIKVEAAVIKNAKNKETSVVAEIVAKKSFKDPSAKLEKQNPVKHLKTEIEDTKDTQTPSEKLGLQMPGKVSPKTHQHVSIKKPKIFRDKKLKETFNRIKNRKKIDQSVIEHNVEKSIIREKIRRYRER
ncbi:MAG: hypothetical protein O3C19_01940 [Bacteroidetes bacterium]|nr:hypothetical protein [Bacteroidota bacterium]